jgi:hypothetical protein
MIWLQPWAALGLLALVAPLLVHLLVYRTGPRVAFPTIRFIRASRLASSRRRVLEDAPLLAVRVGILAAAAAALAGPFLVTASRRHAWDARTIRAVVSSEPLSDGIAQAIAWLDRQAPARRELVIRSTFPLGSITSADVSRVPPAIGLVLERTSSLPSSRTVAGAPVLFAQTGGGELREVQREIILNGTLSSVRDIKNAVVPASRLAVEIVAPDDQRRDANEVLAAVLADRVPAPAPNRFARVVLTGHAARPEPEAIRTPWMADAAARIWRDAVRNRLVPDQLRFGSSEGRLVVAVEAVASDPVMSPLVRSVLDSLAPRENHGRDEIVPIPDAQLAAWSRPAAPAEPPRSDTLAQDDRRWLWGLALALLAIEAWIRRGGRPSASAPADVPSPEHANVA